jgi:hypothetical protein
LHQAPLNRILDATGVFLKIGSTVYDYHWSGFTSTMVRYHFLIFPVVAVITAQGIFTMAKILAKYSASFKKKHILCFIIALLFLAPFAPALIAFKTKDIFVKQEFYTHLTKGYAETAMELRSILNGRFNVKILLSDFVEARGGSDIAVFSALAGPHIFYCYMESAQWKRPISKPWISFELSDEKSGFGVFDTFLLDAESSFGIGRQEILYSVFSLEQQAILNEGIEFIVSASVIDSNFLELISTINDNEYFIYRITYN